VRACVRAWKCWQKKDHKATQERNPITIIKYYYTALAKDSLL